MENIKIIQCKNKYNYTILQLKINYTKKQYQTGFFTIGADKTTKTKKEFFEIMEDLKKCNFKEV